MRTPLTLLVSLLPASPVKNRLLTALGHRVARSASFGPCLVVRVDRIVLGEQAYLGPFNVLRDLTEVRLGDHAILAQWNWVSAARLLTSSGSASSLTIGEHAAVTSRHYIDASGGVRVGAYSTVAGVRSTFITHGIRWRDSTQRFNGIVIGEHCIIGSNCAITPGTTVEDRVVVGMGATISGRLEASSLYVQARAGLVRRDLEGAYFGRTVGRVDPAPVQE